MRQAAEAAAHSSFSPVLFMTTTGEPMRFFLRPGPAKVELQPVIRAGGGLVCRAQQPGVILLADAEEIASQQENTAHWYISTQYVRDCVKKNEQLDVEGYRFGPEQLRRRSTRQTGSSTSLAEGRLAYTSVEDEAIMSYVAQHLQDVGGNRLWQEMAKNNVTNHSWQSMKYRYTKKLSHRRQEGKEGEGDQEPPSSSEEHLPPPVDGATPDLQTHQPEHPHSAKPEPNPEGEPEPTRSSEGEPEPPRSAEGKPEPPRSSEGEPEPPRSSEGEPEPPRSAEGEPEPPRSSEGEPEPPRSAEPSIHSLCPSSPGKPLLEKSPPTQTGRKRARPTPSSGQRTTSPPEAEDPEQASTSEGGAVTQTEPKRKLGILETATREFEDESASDQESPAPHSQPTEPHTALTQPAPGPSPEPDLQPDPGPDRQLVPPPAKPHLFLFERDSQQSSQEAAHPASQPIRSQEGACLTQGVQDDILRIRGLMEQTNQDLVSVTKALLRSSGDFPEALLLLSNPSSAPGVFWSGRDDTLLLSGDSVARQRLLEAYGEKAVAKRLFFLQME